MKRLIVLAALLLAAAWPSPAQEEAAKDAGPTLTLEHVLRTALGTNEVIGQQREELYKSHLLRRQAWLYVVPTATFGSSLIRNDREQKIEFEMPGMDASSGGFTIQPLYDYNFNVSASQSIYLGGRIPKALRLSKVNIGLSEDLLDQAKRDLLFQVCVTYAQVEKAQRSLEISREALRLAGEQLAQTEVLFRAGEIVRTSVLRSEALKVAAERTVIVAEADLDKAKEALAVLSGIQTPFKVESMAAPAIPSEDLRELVAVGLRTRTELLLNDKQVEMTDLQKGIAFGERLPSVVAAFTWTRQRAAFPSSQFWRLICNVSVPIYDGGASSIKQAQALADKRKLNLQRQLLERQIRSEITTAYLDYASIHKSLETVRKQLELVERTYKDIERFYQVGEATDLDRQDAFQQLNEARISISNLQTDAVVVLFSLRRSLGLLPVEIE